MPDLVLAVFGDARLQNGGPASGVDGGGGERLTAVSWLGRAARDCRVLALKDTSEIHFTTREGHERELGRIGHGNIRGVRLNPIQAVDAEDGGCLGLVTGKVRTRTDAVKAPHRQRAFADRELSIWLETAEAAKPVLARARMVTIIADRGSDIYEE